jgi:RNA polymerase sigma-70 factor (ECF subfamily)
VADDREIFEGLYRSHVGAVSAFVRRRTDALTAEEVVAETFLVCWRRLERVPGEPLPWLYGVARRCLQNHVRAERRAGATKRRLRELPHRQGLTPLDVLEGITQAQAVLEAMSCLSARDREALRLDAWEQLSAADAARVAGCSTPTFRVRLHRARRRLAALLEQSPSQDRLQPREEHS